MSHRRLTWLIFSVFVLAVFFHYLGWLKTPENLLRQAVIPFTKTAYHLQLGVKNLYDRYLSRQDLFEKNQQCLNQLNKLAIDKTELEILRQENQSLRSLLNFSKKEKKMVLAEIIGQSADSLSTSLFINRGSDDNIKLNDPVVAEEGLLLGKIIWVDKKISLIQLITDNQSKVAAAVLNQEKTVGVVNGEHGISIQMTMIPLNEVIKINDLIVTSGLETNLPRGLIIGRVETISKELYAPFQSARLQPLVDFNKVTVAGVLVE